MFVTFIYEKDSERLLRHVTGTDEDEVILQSLAWSEKNSLPITTEGSERLQGASEDKRSTETELLRKIQNGSATEEIDSTSEILYTARRSTRKTQYRRDPPNAHFTTAIIGWMKSGTCDFIGKRGIAKITTAAGRVARDFGVESPSVNRSIYFPAFVFLLLFTLLLLLSEQFSRFSVPSSVRESGKAIDQAAVEKATLIDPQAVTKRGLQSDLSSALTEIRRRFSGAGLFPSSVESKAPVSYQQASLGTGFNQVAEKQTGERSGRKNQVWSNRSRLRVNLVIRTHVRSVGVFERRLGRTANRLSWHKIGNDIRKLERRITRLFLPASRRGGRYALSR